MRALVHAANPATAFTVNWTAFSIVIVMIGGIGTIEGPIVGVVLFYLLNKFFPVERRLRLTGKDENPVRHSNKETFSLIPHPSPEGRREYTPSPSGRGKGEGHP